MKNYVCKYCKTNNKYLLVIALVIFMMLPNVLCASEKLEEFYLDSYSNKNIGYSGPVESTSVLIDGNDYLLIVDGTISVWRSWVYTCKGTPEENAKYPSSHVDGKVGLDPVYIFACKSGSSTCKHNFPIRYMSFQISLDNQRTWFSPEPLSEELNPDHVYKYKITGKGFCLYAKFLDNPTSDNYGKFKIELQDLSNSCNYVDSDNDGVIDDWDLCNNTPSGYFTDKNGCHLINDSLVSGFLYIKNESSIKGSAMLIQSGELHQKSNLESKGSFYFNRVDNKKPFSVIIRKQTE